VAIRMPWLEVAGFLSFLVLGGLLLEDANGIGRAAPVAPIEIVSFGPTSVQAGEMFNVQPNGESAMWVRAASDIPKDTRVELGDVIIDIAINGSVATFLVPRNLARYPGTLPLVFVGMDGAIRSTKPANFEVRAAVATGVKIVDFGPNLIHRGQPFNVQPNGNSAMWMRASVPLPAGVRVRMGNAVLDAQVSGDLVTFSVPLDALQPGAAVPLVIVGGDGAALSDTVSIDVVD